MLFRSWSTTAPASSEGQNTFYVRQVDTAGNTSQAASFTYTYDTTAPNAPVVTSVVDNASGNISSVAVLGTAEPNSTITVFDGSQMLGTATANSDGTWSYSIPASDIVKNDILHATATDVAGNTSGASPDQSVIIGTQTADDISGTAGAETILALSGDDMIRGFVGADQIDGGTGYDTLVLTGT